MQINISQEDIDSGTKRSVTNCAIARTFKRIMNNEMLDICVTTCSLQLNGRNYPMPHYITQFIHSFDSSIETVAPISFDIPDLVLT